MSRGLEPPSERSYFVIFNPTASRGGAARSREVIERTFREAGAHCRLECTEYRGHATELAQEALTHGWSTVVAVGGDGIVHEVVNGLMHAAEGQPAIPLGIIPLGSGNDFIKSLGIPAHEPAEAVRQILAATPRAVDVGRVQRHRSAAGPEAIWYFTNGIGIGFDAQVALHASRVRKLRGFAIYAWALLKTLRELRAPRIQVIVDGREVADRPLILTTISNGPCHGGTFWLCPGARIDDGQLDILIADARSLPRLLLLLPRVLFGKHLGQTGVELLRGRRVTVRSAEALPIHADGEIVAEWTSELEIELDAHRLLVLAGAP